MAKDLARLLNYTYIDSGAMYRAITLYFIEQAIDPKDTEAVKEKLPGIDIQLATKAEQAQTQVLLNQRDVSEAIRTMEVSGKVSEVAAIKEVRAYAVALQQAFGRQGGVVMDGRDIGTVVFPDAELKIFMTASEEVRIQRRYSELLPKYPNITLEEVRANIRKRDLIDSTREADPLTQASDAIVLDNSDLSKEEQLELVMEWYRKAVA